MKCCILLLTALFAAVSAQAGSFGGPPPFSNGSPLTTGIDGSYQATARATNVTGIFRFRYSGGSQTESASQNSWIFFVNGQVQRGAVAANINGSKINGVLDSLSAGTSTNSSGSISLPVVLLNANNSGSGEFWGKMNLNSPTAAFSGNGQLLPSPGSTNQIIGINTNVFGGVSVTTSTYTNAPGNFSPVEFRFRGVRTATTSSSTTSTN